MLIVPIGHFSLKGKTILKVAGHYSLILKLQVVFKFHPPQFKVSLPIFYETLAIV